MTLYLTSNPIIDPTHKHIMMPDAFEDWVGLQSWIPYSVPEFTLGGDPKRVTLPAWAAYAFTDHTIASGVIVRAYYFVERADVVPAPYADDGEALAYAYFDLRIDAPHTFGLGGTNWAERGHSFFRRTSLYRDRGEYERDPLNVSSDAIVGQGVGATRDRYSLIGVVVTEQDPTTIFAGKQYARHVVYFETDDDEKYGTADEILELAEKAARINKAEDGTQSGSPTVGVRTEALFLVPYTYISSIINATPTTAYYRSGVPLLLFYPIANLFEQNSSVNFITDFMANAYEVGNGALSINIRPVLPRVSFTVRARVQQSSGFQIWAEYDGEQYDLTPYCSIPYSVVDENTVANRAQQQAISNGLAAISVGVSLAGGNPVSALSGGLNVARQFVRDVNGAPVTTRPGNAFAQYVGSGWGLLHLRTRPNSSATVNANKLQGSIQGDRLSVPLSTALQRSDADTPHVAYVEGEIYPFTTGSSYALTLADRMFSDLFRDLYHDGVYFWDDASAYRGDPFAV